MEFYFKLLNIGRFLKIPQLFKKIIYRITHLRFVDVCILLLLIGLLFGSESNATEIVENDIENSVEIVESDVSEIVSDTSTSDVSDILLEIKSDMEVEQKELIMINNLLFVVSIFVFSLFIYMFIHCLLERRKI